MSSPAPLALRTAEVSVSYGGVVANDTVSIEVPAGAVVGLIGPNGAGKTTFIDAVSGFTEASGEIFVGGQAVARLSPHQRARAGVARTWQSIELFEDLSVLENARVSVQADSRWPLRRRRIDRTVDDPAMHWLERFDLAGAANAAPAQLSLGQQKLLGVVRALASRASVLLLDEPAAGLDSEESKALGVKLQEIAASGPGVLLVDHDVDLVLQACSYVYVLDFGKLIAAGAPAEVRVDEAVKAAYLGHADTQGATTTTEGSRR